jgi:hypothetical protein
MSHAILTLTETKLGPIVLQGDSAKRKISATGAAPGSLFLNHELRDNDVNKQTVGRNGGRNDNLIKCTIGPDHGMALPGYVSDVVICKCAESLIVRSTFSTNLVVISTLDKSRGEISFKFRDSSHSSEDLQLSI